MIRKEILRTVFSLKFCFAALIVTVMCFFANPAGVTADADTAVYHLLLDWTADDLIGMGERYSSYGILMSFRENYWFPIIFPVLASLPVIYSFGDEWLTGYYYVRLQRTKRLSYAVEKSAVAMACGFAVMCVGIGIYAAVCMAFFPPLSDFAPDTEMMDTLYGATGADRVLSFGRVLLHVGMCGGIAVVFSMLCLMVFHDRFFSLTVPMMLQYLGTKVENYYLLAVRYRYHGEPPLSFELLQLLMPSTYLSMERRFGEWYGISDEFWYLYLMVLAAVLAVAMVCMVKRRNR